MKHERAIRLLSFAAHTAAANRRYAASYGTVDQAQEQALIEGELTAAVNVLFADAKQADADQHSKGTPK